MLAYLGPSGTFSEVAAKRYREAKNPKLKLKAFPTIFEVIHAVNNDNVKAAVVPIENSVEGSVSASLDLLANKDIKLKIIQEIDLPIEHHLIALKGHTEINHIISHPQPLGQCQHYLRTKYPNASLESSQSTAAAVKKIIENNLTGSAAIASSKAIKEGLVVVENNIADQPDNITRFAVLSRNPIKNVTKQKTSIIFSPGSKDKPGGLYEVLGHFAKHNINLTKIESRPQKNTIGSYLFFVDFECAGSEKNTRELLNELGQIASFFKNLGSYPVGL